MAYKQMASYFYPDVASSEYFYPNAAISETLLGGAVTAYIKAANARNDPETTTEEAPLLVRQHVAQ